MALSDVPQLNLDTVYWEGSDIQVRIERDHDSLSDEQDRFSRPGTQLDEFSDWTSDTESSAVEKLVVYGSGSEKRFASHISGLGNKRKRINIITKKLTCQYCSKKFQHESRLVQHMRLHTGSRPFVCAECNRSYTTKYKLKDHCIKKGHIFTA